MKITKQKHGSTSLRIVIIIVSILVFLAIAAVYLVGFKGSLFGWQPFRPPASAQSATTPPRSSSTNHGTKDNIDTKAETQPNKTTDQIPVNKTLTATFIELSQSGGYVTFNGNANDTSTEGTCSIVFSNPNDRPVSRTVHATLKDGMAVCGPVQIPETEFSFLGEWTATFRYYINDTQAVTERKLTIQ